MKTSPWKFLVGLTSRRRQEQAQDSSIGDDTNSKASPSDSEQPLALPLNSTEASATPAHDANVQIDQSPAASNDPDGAPDVARVVFQSDVGELDASKGNAADHSNVKADALVEERKTRKPSRRPQRSKPPERPRPARARAAVESAVHANEDQGAQTLSSGKTAFLDDVAGLDAEIHELKNLLAQKLYLQNVQLKKMLERFDVS